nr:YihY/virulence factor BrkB family protein [Tessaracoccus coleopterorum]
MVSGLAGALWAASGYVGAFSHAMNRIYEVEEGRPFWKHKPQMLLLTALLVVILALILAALVLTGPVARGVGDLIGLGDSTVLLWNIVKWPVVVALAILAVAVLYYFTPNVKQPRFRWISLGAMVALVVSALAVLGFSFYVSNFASYNATYGAIGSVIVLLLGLWIINNVLLFGAEIDAEIERVRELQGGLAAEETILLPPRDTGAADKLAARQIALVEAGRRLRGEAAERTHAAD